MKNGKWLALLVAVFIVGTLATTSYAATRTDQVTVGDLLVQIARAKNLAATNDVTAEASLRAAGYNLPRLDRNKPLTEGDVASISNAVGVRVATSNPGSRFSQRQIERYVTSMSRELGTSPTTDTFAATNTGNNTYLPEGSGSGKSNQKPKSKSPKKPKKPKKPKPPDTGTNPTT